MEEQGSDFFQARSRCGALFLKCGVEPGCIKKVSVIDTNPNIRLFSLYVVSTERFK